MLARLLLVASLSAPVGLAQFRPGDHWAESDEDRAEIEYERSRQQQAAYELSRALAHASLGVAASTIEPQALCPAMVSPDDVDPTFVKRALQPLTPRSALRPTAARWSNVAPASQSAAGIFSEYISEQVVQSRCINCHVEGGVSGHTRLVLSASTVDGHEALNLAVFENLTATIEGATDLILNKIQGVAHGGGIQVPAGSADFANMERFLRLLSGEGTSGTGLSPDSLFEGVTMASPARTLWRAALIFAGRLPTRTELGQVRDGQDASLRRAIRTLMTGPRFHDFLIRASNDRLLTDRHLEFPHPIDLGTTKEFVNIANSHRDLTEAARANGVRHWDYPEWRLWRESLVFGVARAPLELIAHVAENDLPYTEILTADYIMANPVVAAGYGATTVFENLEDPLEFKPSEIVSYYRNDRSKEYDYDREFGTRITNPGNLTTEYPHAGILNTNVFLRRYPTTATNRNRARSRWTYYHFLGLDIEKSAARTTDPDALADTDNPTMKNPACTVCHRVMDPVAGAFQNYGDEGLYRHKHGGLDSLPGLYKYPKDGSVSPYQRGDTWFRDMRKPGFDGTEAPSADNSLQWLAEQIVADNRFAEATVKFWWPAVMGVEISQPPEDETDSNFQGLLLASAAQAAEVTRLAEAFRAGIVPGRPYNLKDLLTEMVLSKWFRAESVTSPDPVRAVALRDAGSERLLTPEELDLKTEAVSGYRWGRRLSQPWDARRPRTYLNDIDGYHGYGLLYGGIDSDGITKRAGEISPLMAAVAQSHAASISCPVVFREFYLWPPEKRMLFGGIDAGAALFSEAGETFSITAEEKQSQQTVSLRSYIAAGEKTARLRFTNPYYGGPGEGNHRTIWLDKLTLRNAVGTFEETIELESFRVTDNCAPWKDSGYFWMRTGCTLPVPIQIPSDGAYFVEVDAWAWNTGGETARLEVSIEADTPISTHERSIRNKLVELHWKLFGVSAARDSADIDDAYSLFLDVLNRKRSAEGNDFWDSDFECRSWRLGRHDHLYFEGIIDDALEVPDLGSSRLNSDRVREFIEAVDTADPQYAARAWVVTLAYLLTDSRYLYY